MKNVLTAIALCFLILLVAGCGSMVEPKQNIKRTVLYFGDRPDAIELPKDVILVSANELTGKPDQLTSQAIITVQGDRYGSCTATNNGGWIYNEYYDCLFPSAFATVYAGGYKVTNTGPNTINLYFGRFTWNVWDYFINNFYKYTLSPGQSVYNPFPGDLSRIMVYVWRGGSNYTRFTVSP